MFTDVLKAQGPYSEVFPTDDTFTKEIPTTEILPVTKEKFSDNNDKDYLDLTKTEQKETELRTTKQTATKQVLTTKKNVRKYFSPGKYVASKSGNTYHEAKCEWAKRIKSYRQVWLESKEIAWEKGFKAHKCVN
ncbi:hypothetical protein HYU21_02505 [Candidatus Woesearchaeota archaeon]|nr:hypothetical protein [Candidatus Woesearchaeota archaeon]